MKSKLVILFILLATAKAHAQFDIARLEVVHIPKGDKQDIEFNRLEPCLMFL